MLEWKARLPFNPQLQTIVAVLVYAGLRRVELLWITLDDIDLSRRHGGHGLIRIRAKTIDRKHWQPKTSVNHAVPISRSLREHLNRFTPPTSNHGWYFPSPGCRGATPGGGGGLYDVDNFSRALRRANKDVGLQWSSLDYRHTFGSQLAQNGVSLFKIATLMGNSPEICRRHYTSLIPEAMVGEVEFGFTAVSFCETA